MPSILFINRVYPPDSGATGRVLEFIAQGFLSAGWDVSVLCTAVEREAAKDEVREGIRIVRVGIPFSKKSLLVRALGYALMIPVLLLRALQLSRHDVVVTKTDPPMLMILGPILKFFKKSGAIHWAQDLYPEVAEELGVLRKGGVIAGTLRRLSTVSLRSHDEIIAVGSCMKERLVARGISSAKIRIIPNIGMERSIVPKPRLPNRFRDRYGLGKSLVVMYSGNLGRAHEFGTILGSARTLQEAGEERIRFLFAGEGPAAGNLRAEVELLGLKNVLFLPEVGQADLSESLAAADLHLVTMLPGMEGLVVPSKFYGVMAAARPCLFIGPKESEIARVIHECNVGAVIATGDSDLLTHLILKYLDNNGLCFIRNDSRDSLLQTDARGAFIDCASGIRMTKSKSLS